MSLQIQSLLKVFEMLDIEERQKLLPMLTQKAGIFDRETVNNIPDVRERDFVKLVFYQTLSSVIKLQYIQKCKYTVEEIKNATWKGKVTKYSDKYYYYLYQDKIGKNIFTNLKDEEISKEEFFDSMLFSNNLCWKTIKIVKQEETIALSEIFHNLK